MEGGFDPDPTRGPSMDRPSCESDLDSFFKREWIEAEKSLKSVNKQEKNGFILNLGTPDHLPTGCRRVMV